MEEIGTTVVFEEIDEELAHNIRDNVTTDSRDPSLAILEISTLGLIFVLIVFGNSCVLLALIMRKLKMNRMYYFLLHLCIADLITAFFNVLPQLMWDITYRFYGGNILCKSIKYLQILGPYLSSYVLVMTSIDRYQAICYPLSNCAWTPKRSQLMISFAWIIALLCCIPQVIIFSYQLIPNSNQVYDCWGTFPQPYGERIYVTWYAISFFFVPFILLTVTHVCICRTIWRNVHQKRKSVKLEQNKVLHNDDSDRVSSCSSTNDSIARSTNLLVTVGRSYRFKGRGRVEVLVDGSKSQGTYNPRSHSSLNGLSRAKIKTIKITIVVILCYILCSSPFILCQLWAYWWPEAQQSPFWSGPLLAILMLMPSLNSCVNPWIVLFFNKNLLKTLKETCRCGHWCHKTEYIHQIGEYTSNCDTKYSSQTDIDLINSTILTNKKSTQRRRSCYNNLSVPNNSINNNKKLGPKSMKNEKLTVEYSTRNKRLSLSSSDNMIHIHNNIVISPAIEMQTLCSQSYSNGISF